MLRWLLSWVIETRLVFSFWDGRKRRKEDPMQLALAFWSRPRFDPDALMEQIAAKPVTVGNFRASADLAAHVRDVFGIKQLTAGGLTDGECVHIANDLMDLVGDVKKNTSSWPTAARSTESGTPLPPSLENPPMPYDSDYGPISSVSG